RRGAHAGRRQQGQATPGLHAARELRRWAPANVRVLQRRRGMRWPIVGLVVALLVGGSCLAAEAQTPSSLTVQVSTEPPGLDLTATPASATAAVVFYNVQECLVKIDRHGKIVPWLAERWRVTDQKNYTFFLKPGVRFHNGRELKAADVKFVIERAMNRSEEHTSELQSRFDLVCRLLLEKKK